MDISKFPPLSTDFKKDGIAITQKANPVANNSVCAAKRSAAAGPTPDKLTPSDMSFITMDWITVNVKTLGGASTLSGISVACAVATALILVAF